MSHFQKWRLPANGWRKSAAINTILTATLAILLTLVTVTAYSVPSFSIFFEGSCAHGTNINLGLHLLINIISTLIIASSNFFMQVFNAPSMLCSSPFLSLSSFCLYLLSLPVCMCVGIPVCVYWKLMSSKARSEVDRAHEKNVWLEIGVPSWGNVFHVSKSKTLAWVLFNLSSIPIHLVFNSAIFHTDYSGSQWLLTMGSESFVQGDSDKFGIGAGFVSSGSILDGLGYGDTCNQNNMSCSGDVEMGVPTVYDAYDNSSMLFTRYTAELPSTAKAWKNITTYACRTEYQACKGRTNYRNLLMIIDIDEFDDHESGWALNELYNFSMLSTAWLNASLTGQDVPGHEYFSLYVDALGNMPQTKQNSLWFSGSCSTISNTGGPDSLFYSPCQSSCDGPLGPSPSFLGRKWIEESGLEGFANLTATAE